MKKEQRQLVKQIINTIASATAGMVGYFDQSGYAFVSDTVSFNISPAEYIEIVTEIFA